MANPFTVQPLGGLQNMQMIGQGMQGIAQNVQTNRAEEQKQALMQQAGEIMDRGNPQEIAAFSAQHPEVGEAMMSGIQFANDSTRQNMRDSMQRIIAGEDPEQVISERVAMVQAQGGDPSDTLRELERARQDPDAYRKQVESVFAMSYPKEYEAFAKATGRGGRGAEVGKYNPRDYTTDSFAKFVLGGMEDPSVLQRYSNQQSVDIGGVPHVFDPTVGGYRPASMMGAGQQQAPQQPGQQPSAQQQGQRQPQRQTPPQLISSQGGRITAQDVAQNRRTIVEAEEQARLESGLLQQGLRRTADGSLEVVPGSKLEREVQKDAAKADLRQEQAARSGGTAIQDLGRGIQMIDESRFASGTAAAIIPQFANLPARRLQSMVDSIESNVSVNSLNEMRSASEAGGALGNVSDKQSALLAGLLGNLDITQEPEVLKDNMKRIQNIFMDIVHGVGQGPERNRLSFDDMGRRVEGGAPWVPDPEVVRLERENQAQRREQSQQQGGMSEQDADAFIDSILGR